MMEKHTVRSEYAAKVKDWFLNRNGLLIWKSVNLSDPGKSWTTPALDSEGKPMTKPSWESDSKPYRHITSLDDVEVVVPKEVKRFRVAVRRGTQGLNLKCTHTSSEKINKALDKFGPESWYAFDYWTQEAVIYVPEKTIPLSEWQEEPIAEGGQLKEE